MERNAILVDPYLGAADFATAFAARGVTPVAVFSTPEPLAGMSWETDRFPAVHFYDGDFEALVSTAKGYDPVCIVPGNEAGVEMAERLVQVLTPQLGNAPGAAGAQRDKWQQHLALRRAGVPQLRQIGTDDPAVVADWIARSGLADTPLVLKPTKSAGTDSVYLVGPGEDWRAPFDAILGVVNQMGIVNDMVLVMEFADGPEFMVDTYSAGGRHGLVMVSVYGKHNRGNRLGIYDLGETLAPDDPRTAELFKYTTLVADAVGIRNAAGHAEVILTAAGPRLVEIAARFSGSCMQIHQRISTGDSQLDRAVRHYLDDDFVAGYQMPRKARTMWLSAHSAGMLASTQALETLIDLPTVRRSDLPRPGTWVADTVDIGSSLGWVILASDDQAALEADYTRIRELEAGLVFTPRR
jgi:biotin carboxylase